MSEADARPGLRVNETILIPDWELQETFIRASGPGGQNVNKVSTAVQLRWNVDRSSLPSAVKERIRRALKARLTNAGEIVLEVKEHRSQALNREAARVRLADLIRRACAPRKRRVATRPTKASVRRRLDAKSKRGDLKSLRSRVKDDD